MKRITLELGSQQAELVYDALGDYLGNIAAEVVSGEPGFVKRHQMALKLRDEIDRLRREANA